MPRVESAVYTIIGGEFVWYEDRQKLIVDRHLKNYTLRKTRDRGNTHSLQI